MQRVSVLAREKEIQLIKRSINAKVEDDKLRHFLLP